MSDPAEKFATPRIASGALFVSNGLVLLVHKVYGNGWDIPGGYVDRGESPADACRREVREELGIDVEPQRLLVHDWAPSEREGDKLLYVFDGGLLPGKLRAQMSVDRAELDRWEWVNAQELDEYLIPRLARRLREAYRAHVEGATFYLEHGVPRSPTVST